MAWVPLARWPQGQMQVIAVRESDEREVRGRFDGSELTLHFTAEKMRKASLRDRQLVWWTGAQPWEKQ